MTEFTLQNIKYTVDGGKVQSANKNIGRLLEIFAICNEEGSNLTPEYLIVSAAKQMGAEAITGDYLLQIGGKPNTVY